MLRFGRRDGPPHRFIVAQVALFFLAAGVWVTGLVTGIREATLVSIVLLVIALILGTIGRRQERR